jgi:gluconokinase
LFLYRLDDRRFVLGGALSDGGNLLATIARLTGDDIGDALDRPPGRVLLLPHLGGERTPGWRVDAAGVMTGVTHSTQSLDIAQAAYEGIAYRIGTIWDLLRSSWSDWSSQTNLASEVDQVREVVATGAALLARPGWAQLLSDVLGMPVAMAPTTEASARGVAMVALGSEDAPTRLGPRFEPRPERTAQHREARERLDTLYRAIASA